MIKSQPEDKERVGLELKIARIRKGIKQWELARQVGICQNTLSLIEQGRRKPAPELLRRLLEALDVAEEEIKIS